MVVQEVNTLEFNLTENEKQILLETARKKIKADLGLGAEALPAPTDKLKQICGAFVTLHSGGMLRGCIGNIIGRMPLINTVESMAHAAAFNDPRFPKLKPSEFDVIDIEISVLSPLRTITDVSEIKVGVHGIIITRGFSSGVLLPQVAVEQGWDRDTFLQHTCLKAGLPPEAWTDPAAKIEIFSAIVFSERD